MQRGSTRLQPKLMLTACWQRRTRASALTCLLFVGCATPVVPTPVGGSKADGVVILSATYGMWQSPDYKWDEALVGARQTCIGWGYRDAEPFKQFQTRCTNITPAGCANTQVVMRFQCTGSDAPAAALSRPSDTRTPTMTFSRPSDTNSMQCQVDADCGSGQSCRSRKGGGTECRASTN